MNPSVIFHLMKLGKGTGIVMEVFKKYWSFSIAVIERLNDAAAFYNSKKP